ncbi:HPr family phosphocarrier protein [Brevibacillus humidisoli]|uniref:HPr family phosphocarrier protein n=1 Tax=Brevibacillus humidisoli TaxID=2895522 RepID=UPI001E484310|nr:HPr family phosphocarrier protein [Brevibacillus humidisoli]UFJ41604.1 HPr family phosphocarrier protein [Brevibacillus humidisoli]
MVSFTVKVNAHGGLHARPASILVNRSNQFKSSITIIKNGKQADSKSIINVMALAARVGDDVTIEVSGEDEQQAASALRELFETNFAVQG